MSIMTTEIAIVLAVLIGTVILFISEWLRVDVIAICIMLALAWLGLVTPTEAFSGFASNAVISIIAVMILGYGVDRSGVMQRLTKPILRLAGTSQPRLVALVCSAIGLISAFMQNIGATALFLPAVLRISKTGNISTSRLLMPMGFAAILGGTLTMVASGPLIILNDLLKQGGESPFGLFSVTPVGLALLGAGIAYFLLLGRFLLPTGGTESVSPDVQRELIDAWQLPSTLYECTIPERSSLAGKTREEARLHADYGISLLALTEGEETVHVPWRYARFSVGQRLALMGLPSDVERFMQDYGLEYGPGSAEFNSLRTEAESGFAEVIIPPRASVAGQTLRQIALRKNFRVEPIMLLSGTSQQRGDFSDRAFHTGDTMVVYGTWHHIKALDDRRNFVVATPIGADISGRSKPISAIMCFLGTVGLILAGTPLPMALLSGALAMILLRVITIDEAYKAVDWRTVFLLAGLIPLGVAMEKTGAAAYLAHQMMAVLKNSHPALIMLAVGTLTTIFSLFMSNVAATVLLVPLVMLIGAQVDIHPRALALLVAVCASNSFVLPTHQVNALLMSPGGYHNADYLKAGGVMSLVFLAVAVGLVYLIFT